MTTPRDQMVSELAIGDCVWSPCARLGFRRSTIVRVDEHRQSFFVESKDDPDEGQNREVQRADVRLFFDNGPDRTFQDNTDMVHLDDANILDNIQRRYQKDLIYTYTANVLLAVNPYKKLPNLYSEEVMASYRGKNQGTLAPHPFAIADIAYRQLLRDRRNQALVISGESGAGKTETAKKTMHYLTSISRTDQAQGVRFQDKIINANPILEAFGNASTVMNCNSSRFGKYNEMFFNRVGSLVGAGIKTFLLESSRVVSQQDGEQNYHVFYELLAGMDEETSDRLMLDRYESFKLLHSGGGKPIQENSDDSKRLASEFKDLKQALATFVSEETTNDMWDVVGALIHLGEVEFDSTSPDGESDVPASSSPTASPCASPSDSPRGTHLESQEAKVEVSKGTDALAQAADLLGLGHHRLEQVLKFKEMHVKHVGGRTSNISCPRSKAQAQQTLQCVIKILYKRLFDKIVALINAVSNTGAATMTSESGYNSIGTLDIYGFERLKTNSFEQMCINLANERLQQFFVEEVLVAEQRMYSEELLSIPPMDLPDAFPVVNGIQSIMSKLDEHSLRSVKNLVRCGPGEDKDSKFCEQVHREFIKDPKANGPIMALKLKGSRSGNGPGLHDGFQIRHYAGQVSYSTKGWIDKNNDSLVPEIEALLADGTKQLVVDMADSQGIAAASGERLMSVSTNYLSNLNNLLETLSKCSVHYIRCFNPNQNRQAGIFDAKYVLDQVIQCGTVELVKIMHHGYPHRCFLKELRERFTSLLPADFCSYSDRDFLHAVLLAWNIDESQWTLGTKRLFLKAGQLKVMENFRDLGCGISKDIIRKIRIQFAKKKFRAYGNAIEFVAFLKKATKQSKNQRVLHLLVKAMHNYVRIHRWLKKVRVRLYGIPADAEEQDPYITAKFQKVGLAIPWICDRSVDSKFATAAKLFVTLNSAETPRYLDKLQNEVQMSRTLQGNLVDKWTSNASESVLYFTGSSVLSARLSKASSRHAAGSSAAEDGLPALEDLREVDLHETGSVLPAGKRLSGPEKIVAMCQHQEQNEVFATCNHENRILVFKWQGVKTGGSEQAVRALASFNLRRSRPIVAMCFLPKVPVRVSEQGGHVLLILSKVPGRHWLSISIHTIVGSSAVLTEAAEEVMLASPTDSEGFEYLRKHGFQVSFFGMSHSNSMVIVAGRNLFQAFEVCTDASGSLALQRVQLEDASQADLSKSIMQKCGDAITSLVPMPVPIRSTGLNEGLVDWLALGAKSGEIFGILIERRAKDGRLAVVHKHTGRFKSNPHNGVPIRSLTSTFEVSACSPKDPYMQSMTRSLMVNKAPINHQMLVSLGDDGTLVTWGVVANQGWVSANCANVLNSKDVHLEAPNLVAAHSSRLLTHVMLIVDEGRRCIITRDRVSNEESVCSLD
eukprot:CAMPEP_0115125062 /NCGR_PEP_ID=MMETSP0227-20121206/48773_1 /TAXON_ID=89957 /ORGANISM="Polarella glacialis, Strain CCMP 1383" /LENGTH=1400 /DNA_ID=CAMNT_0002528271 /DNA_START=21 /DNA_END=4223 /DNA_ORIENTATION=-